MSVTPVSRCGSSPHTRGAPAAASTGISNQRIIPAYAGSTSPAAVSCLRSWDHPRIRGEHGLRGACRHQKRGSSPHTRGAPPTDDRNFPNFGIIPAYAGSTPAPTPRKAGAADHPRIRGEHRESIPVPCWRRGSSPHTRGAPTWEMRPAKRPGIIPAYAGSTRLPRSPHDAKSDHPRIRGEHGDARPAPPCRGGSSPHTRGAPPEAARQDRLCRIIPAYAGSTPSITYWSESSKDHPRIRGEHAYAHAYTPSRPWIIPAYAGSTRLRTTRRRWRGDHPRIRGEHAKQALNTVYGKGSSPHTRGALALASHAIGSSGIIPAYAGSTRDVPCVCQTPSDHPRIRGEHRHKGEKHAFQTGSSPHTRGAREFVDRERFPARIIPAYAGSTCRRHRRWRHQWDHPRIRGEHLPEPGFDVGQAGSSPHTRGAPSSPTLSWKT